MYNKNNWKSLRMLKQVMPTNKKVAVLFLIFSVFIIMVFYKPTQIPAPWFDEGWTLSVARNWIEKGVYARLLDDKPVSYVGMAWSFPVTVPVGISFQLFGVGVLQGRLPNILLTAVTLFLLYLLARIIYDEKIGLITLLVVLFASTGPHILVMGRQALAEMPMLFYLILGFLGFYYALHRSGWFLLLTALSWGTSITCKQHPLPFLSLALFICLLVALALKRYQVIWKVIIVWMGCIAVYISFILGESWLMKDLRLYGAPMRGLYEVTAFVFNKQVRLDTLRGFFTFGFSTFVGLCFGLFDFLRNRKIINEPRFFVNLIFLTLCLSWLAWFVLLSIGWPKYFFPIAFLSSVYVALLLDQFTHHFSLKFLANFVGRDLRKFRFNWNTVKVMVAIFIILDGMVFTYFYLSFLNHQTSETPYQVAEFINQTTPEDTLVETYDSEIIFLLDRPVYFPPDQIQVELNRRLVLDPDTPIDYDPLAADPDYIIVGPFSRGWKLYESVLDTGKYRMVFGNASYDVYERVR
jgi:4-amino-4-deoxy-L-arabinose transferase-like glycosyltransferase